MHPTSESDSAVCNIPRANRQGLSQTGTRRKRGTRELVFFQPDQLSRVLYVYIIYLYISKYLDISIYIYIYILKNRTQRLYTGIFVIESGRSDG